MSVDSGEHGDSGNIEEVHPAYIAYKEKLYEIDRKTQEELDKSLITLSTIVIGFCLTIRQQFVAQNSKFGFPTMFFIAIFLLILCIAAVLLSYRLSMKVNKKMIKAIDSLRAPDEHYSETRIIDIANSTSIWLFFLGLLSTIVFASLGASGNMS